MLRKREMKQRCRRRSREEHTESRYSQGKHREGPSSTNMEPLSQVCLKEGRDSQGSLKSRVLPDMCPPAAPLLVHAAVRQGEALRWPLCPGLGEPQSSSMAQRGNAKGAVLQGRELGWGSQPR